MRSCLLIAASLLATACEAPSATEAPPAGGLRAIGAVQGSGPRSPLEGQPVVVEGVVVGVFAGLGGAFLQSQTDDGDPATAEGLFLDFGASALARPRVGDRVRINILNGNSRVAVDQ